MAHCERDRDTKGGVNPISIKRYRGGKGSSLSRLNTHFLFYDFSWATYIIIIFGIQCNAWETLFGENEKTKSTCYTVVVGPENYIKRERD